MISNHFLNSLKIYLKIHSEIPISMRDPIVIWCHHPVEDLIVQRDFVDVGLLEITGNCRSRRVNCC